MKQNFGIGITVGIICLFLLSIDMQCHRIMILVTLNHKHSIHGLSWNTQGVVKQTSVIIYHKKLLFLCKAMKHILFVFLLCDVSYTLRNYTKMVKFWKYHINSTLKVWWSQKFRRRSKAEDCWLILLNNYSESITSV